MHASFTYLKANGRINSVYIILMLYRYWTGNKTASGTDYCRFSLALPDMHTHLQTNQSRST